MDEEHFGMRATNIPRTPYAPVWGMIRDRLALVPHRQDQQQRRLKWQASSNRIVDAACTNDMLNPFHSQGSVLEGAFPKFRV